MRPNPSFGARLLRPGDHVDCRWGGRDSEQSYRSARRALCSREEGVRLAQKMQVRPRIPVGIQL